MSIILLKKIIIIIQKKLDEFGDYQIKIGKAEEMLDAIKNQESAKDNANVLEEVIIM